MTSTNVMIRPPYTAHHLPHTTCHMPSPKYCPLYTTCLTPPGAWCLQLSKSLDRACRRVHVSIQSRKIGSIFLLESVLGSVEPSRLGVYRRVQLEAYLRACLGVCLRASCELVWECTVKQAGCVASSASGSMIGSIPGSVLGSVQ